MKKLTDGCGCSIYRVCVLAVSYWILVIIYRLLQGGVNHNLSVYQITGSRAGSQVELTKLPKVAPAMDWAVIPPEAGQVEGGGRTLLDITGSQMSLSGLQSTSPYWTSGQTSSSFTACKHLSMHKIKIIVNPNNSCKNSSIAWNVWDVRSYFSFYLPKFVAELLKYKASEEVRTLAGDSQQLYCLLNLFTAVNTERFWKEMKVNDGIFNSVLVVPKWMYCLEKVCWYLKLIT